VKYRTIKSREEMKEITTTFHVVSQPIFTYLSFNITVKIPDKTERVATLTNSVLRRTGQTMST